MNVRAMTDKELARQSSGRAVLPEIKAEAMRRLAVKLRNLRRYQKRVGQGAYGVRRKSD